jgi:hypothetical protein
MVARSLIGAACGIILGLATGLPAFAIVAAAERAALAPPDAGLDQPQVSVIYYTQLLHFAATAGGFGGVIGAIAGATSAVVRALPARGRFPAE